MEPLKKVQVEGFLMFAEPQELFGNLDELCYVSRSRVFAQRFLYILYTWFSWWKGKKAPTS